ncbi:MAG: VUT family protein [Deltaproteobacteria bacterium]|nr:MAG: VUT family protein [Deltaproteobacteria bacterium]
MTETPQPSPHRSYRYLDVITAVFITALLTSNLVASKTSTLFGMTIGVGIFVFPVSYIFGDILTEVYGYKASRRVIWIGFSSAALASLIFYLCDIAPPAAGFKNQDAFHTILGQTPYILAASLTAYFIGEFCNSYVMAKMKIWSKGKHLWMRTIGSTIVGEGVDSLVFYPLAFAIFPLLFNFPSAAWGWGMVFAVMTSNFFLKVLLEALFTPVTYFLVNFLKKAEGVDVYDYDTNFNPFVFEDSNTPSSPSKTPT